MSEIIKGYNLRLKHVTTDNPSTLEQDTFKLITKLSSIADKIAEDHAQYILDLIAQEKKSGYFRDALLEKTKFDINKAIPGLTGGKSRYWRIISAHLYQYFASRYERMSCISIIQDNNHTSITKELYDDLHAHNLYPTRQVLVNIFKNLDNGVNDEIELPLVQLDYAVTGDRIVKPVNLVDNKVVFTIQVGSKEWRELIVQPPTHLDLDRVSKISKPVIYVDKQGELKIRYAISLTITPIKNSNILGCDLGIIKRFTSASLTRKGEYSRELTTSKELDRLSEKYARVKVNKEALYVKKKHIEELPVGREDKRLLEKYKVLDSEYASTRNKLSKLSTHMGWVTARDVKNHALDEDCNTIRLEYLAWVGSQGGKWSHADTQSKIEHVASSHGLKTEYVDAYGTSWELPKKYVENPAPKSDYNNITRELYDSEMIVDKDYSASIAIACRVPRKKALKAKKNPRERVIQPKKCRDKLGATPKRPKRARKSKTVLNSKVSCSVPVSMSTCAGGEQTVLNQHVSNSVFVTSIGDCPPMSLNPNGREDYPR